MIQGKTWGTTELIFKNESVEIHRITVLPKKRCSEHYHNFMYNMFYVESGTLKIKVWKKDYDLCDETILKSQQKTSVSHHEFHMFESFDEPVVAYEIYYLQSVGNDIIRRTCGGDINV